MQLLHFIPLLIKRLYPERQFLYRSRGRVRFITLSPRVQILLTLALLPALAWLAVRAPNMVIYPAVIDAQARRIAELTAERDAAQAHSETAARSAAALQKYLSDAFDRVAELQTSHEELVALVDQHAENGVRDLEQAVAMTGLSLNKLLRAAGKEAAPGVGGPLLGDADENRAPFEGFDESLEHDIARVDQQLRRWADLKSVVGRLPLTAPTDVGEISSRFGARADPFTHARARHSGIDVSAPAGTPIYATAPGKVTHAGLNGPYGYMVEIDHGLGIKTRHGHLSKILVTQGQQVTYRTKIGLIGSTGRSTGPHLHYEVLFNDATQNPVNFLQAGQYVFQER
ncbi:MAG: M23 family metallopeptidase [Pseudomonadota bacterium]